MLDLVGQGLTFLAVQEMKWKKICASDMFWQLMKLMHCICLNVWQQLYLVMKLCQLCSNYLDEIRLRLFFNRSYHFHAVSSNMLLRYATTSRTKISQLSSKYSFKEIGIFLMFCSWMAEARGIYSATSFTERFLLQYDDSFAGWILWRVLLTERNKCLRSFHHTQNDAVTIFCFEHW